MHTRFGFRRSLRSARDDCGRLLGLAASLAGQAPPPATDIFLMSVKPRGDSLVIGPPRNLTARPGYDNQPYFAPDGRTLYFTSVREDGQADIYRLDLRTDRVTRFTQTPESEYSATVMPGGRDVAVIRVERDSTQRLWAFPVRGGEPRLLLERVKPVGYQAWIDERTVGLFGLGSPATLRVADLASGHARILLSSIGRSLQPVPGRRAFSVTQLVAENRWWLVEVDAATGATRPIAPMAQDADYAVWLADGSLLSAQGNALLRLRPGADTGWVKVAELAAPGMGRLSRLAVSRKGEWLAVVAEERR